MTIVFQEPPAPKDPIVTGFTPGAQPVKASMDMSPGAMHKRLMGEQGLPEFTIANPTKSS